jgi:hypothetical protein
MKPILLLDESLQIEIYYAWEDSDLEDNICLKVIESCEEDEKIFKHDESHLYLTHAQAQDLANALLKAIEKSEKRKTGST